MNTLHLLIGLFNRRRVATWTFLLLLTITFLGSSHFTFASSSESSLASTMPLISEPKQILVLFSYHRAEWSDNVQKGIESVFTPYQNVNFFYEYMDTKRLKTKEYLETLRKIYIEKYAKALIDMVICVDNNALDLLVENARTLLPDTPVVFCGINDYSPALHAARPDVTGVVEYGDFSDTLKIAFRARHNATKLYIICDHTETGETNTRDLIAALSTVAPGIQAVLMDRMSYEELFTTLQAADPQQVAFFVSFWKDGTGRNIEPWMLDAVFRKSAIPVFGRSEWMINHGMVGGKCVTGFAQGEAAARIALQILGGTPVSDLPVDTDSPNQYLFDHRMMQHFRIDEDIFPDKSIGFNRPEPFYRVSKTAGTNYLFFLLLLLTALVFLMLNIQQRRKAEKALLREKNIIDAILDSAPGMIYLYNDQGNLERWNKKHEEMSGYSSEEMNGRNVLDWFKGDDKSLSAVTDGLKNTFENGHGEAEADLQRKDGSTIPMYFTATPLTMNDKPYFVGIGIDITERKQAEKALQESEEKFRNIADQSLVGIYLIQDGIFQYVNPKFSEIFGYPAEQYLGLPFDKLIYPEDRDTVEKNIRKRISGEVKTVHYEFRGIRKNSEIVHLEIFGSSTLFNGNPAITGTLLDITDRKRAEEERVLNVLRTKVLLQLNQMTEATLQEVTDFALEEAVRLTNSTIGYLAFLNDDESILTMHSWSKSAMAECGIADKPILYPVETTDLWGEAVRQRRAVITNDYTGAAALKKGYPERHVAVRRHMNTPVFVGSRIVLVAGVGNKTAEYNQDDVQQLTLLMEGMWRLIERKQADESLRESENKYRLIAENTADLISILDMNLRFTYVSPASMRLRGFTVEEAMAQTLDQVLTPDSMRLAFAVFEKEMIVEASGTADPDRTRILELEEYKKDGSTVWVEVSLSLIRDKDRKPVEILIVTRDISERKQAEDAKVKLEDQLQQAQKFEAIGTLAGGIAHDFNNLLMGIQGRVSLLSFDLEASNPHLEHINALEEYIRSATSLTRQLLGFARGGKYEVKPVDVNELLSSSSAMFGRTKKEIQIHTKYQTSALVVEADRGQIEQVLLNLYVNAWQAMPPDGGHLYLETKIVTMDEVNSKPHQVEPGRYVKVSITDTGAGMDEATRLRVFDPFFTTKEKGRGTGLGLASAYGIIKNHGGMITVYSEVGHGTTFNIYLPVSDKDAHREVPIEGGLIRGSATILLVDDEELIIDVGQAMLERLGYRVMVCRGGQEAVKEITDMGNEIDLVILDMVMPGMDGGTTFDQIREIQPDMPVILSSGYAINGHADKIMRRGCNGFIQKPYNISELSQKIRKVLDEPKCSTSE